MHGQKGQRRRATPNDTLNKRWAMHRAYAKKARVEVPPLEEFEKFQEPKVLTLRVQGTDASAVNDG
jgi:hypothetical protein